MRGRPRFADAHGKEVHEAGRAAFASLLTDGPTPTEPPAAPDPRPQRPTGSADQGMRGPAFADNPRHAFADLLRRVL